MIVMIENPQLVELRFDPVTGLIPAVIQDADTGQVLMLGYLNQQAWEQTQREQRVTFYSRSRQRLWVKGESSGNYLQVVSTHPDCDADALLIRVRPAGPTCHRGTTSCFEQEGQGARPEAPVGFLGQLGRVIDERRDRPQDFMGSYTASLFAKGIPKIAQKVGEEAVETVIDAVAGHQDTLPGEAADLLYHLLVLLSATNVPLEKVVSVLRDRHSK